MKLTTRLGVAVLAIALGTAAQAEPQKVQGGTLVLPTTGLAITVADDPARDYMLSGSWALSETGTFDARDVIDELTAKGGALVRGNWVQTGYFDAGHCDTLLAGLGHTKSWKAPVTVWGTKWEASGGDYTFQNDLGTHPMVALCRTDTQGRGLLLQRFLIDRPKGMTQVAMIAELAQARILAAAARSFATGAIRGVPSLHQANVTDRGKVRATRTVRLEKAGLELTLPDDGAVWLLGAADEKVPTDRLDRVLPSLPEVTLEVLKVPISDCKAAFGLLEPVTLTPAEMTQTARPVTGLPAGWTAGPITRAGDQLEQIACTVRGGDALLAGAISQRDPRNLTSVTKVLTALTSAKPY